MASNCDKKKDPNVLEVTPTKSAPKHDFGDLNPKVKPKIASKSFDTKRNTSMDVLKDVARTHLTNTDIPSGRMVGIVLKKLNDAEMFLYQQVNSSVYQNLGFSQEEISKFKGYKIRIPELDSHLPEPETFDSNDKKASAKNKLVINSHNTYISKNENAVEPTVGQLVWVERENNVGFYLEPLSNEVSAPATKTQSERPAGTKSSFSDSKPKVSLSSSEPAESSPPPVQPFRFFKLVRVKADRFEPMGEYGGYSSMKLREDAAKVYNQLKDEVNSLGGIVTTSGGVRSLANTKKSASRSQTSIHYTGLAFDLGMWTGMFDGVINKGLRVKAVEQPYIIEKVGTRNWHVWCRTENPNVPVRKLEAYIFPHKKVTVEGRFFSFTDLAAKYGFTPIGARGNFFSGGKFTQAEWWHFNYTKPLIKGESTFASILEELWNDKQLEGFPGYAKFGPRVWGERWRG
jgi:hypothetical protein